jgi:N-methylhydantoinase A/oxoprolinase/acetone carboxylase beta subunit
VTYRLGIDVGGTNTDAVILSPDARVVAKVKRPVTEDVVTSIRTAVTDVVAASGLDASLISHAMLGTTQVTNAIIERRRLNRVGLVRIGAPATVAIPPLTSWPADLRRAVEHASVVVRGGFEFDGRAIASLDLAAVADFVDRVRGEISALAVSSVFSPVNAEHELAVRDLVARHWPDLPVSLSHEIGSIGLLERENATVLNAAVHDVALRAAGAFRDAVAQAGLQAELFLTQNDGTLMTLDYAMHYPILTVACGPTNSMRGATYLSGVAEAVVVDVGGTSTDIGVIRNGFPRESTMAVEVGGVRTNFRMPDLISLGLGGGSLVTGEGEAVRVGPQSLGYRLVSEGRSFGGPVLTFTDVANAVGAARIGHRDPDVPLDLARAAYRRAVAMVEEGVDRIKTSAQEVPLVAVGGGSALLPDRLAGVSEVVRPDHYDVANAIGAAIAQVSGRTDRVYALEGRRREDVLAEAQALAEADAVRAGADPRRLEVVQVEEIPLAYMPGNATRVRVIVVGPLASGVVAAGG